MLFNSIDFAIFLPSVFITYWFIVGKNLKHQNFLIIIASCIFYGWWNWRFLTLIFFSTIIDYLIGLALKAEVNEQKRKIYLYASIFINIGFLGFFKYYNFFIESFNTAFSFLGVLISARSLDILLPVGISFYTFQTLSYTIDVYKRRLQPTTDFVAFAAFVGFFPQLVAGPIERAIDLLPQFYEKRVFDYSKAVDGMRQILWGLFKKVVIADNCATFANLTFNNTPEYSGSTLALGALFFTFQIYGDFSGYSDIAIGTARLFGFNLTKNFDFPYFSRDIAEFWRRWHISLSTWFRDYLYIPLGGSKGNTKLKIRNTFIIFTVSGLWHGANWTFIVWGLLNAIYFLPLLLTSKNRTHVEIVAKGKYFPTFKEVLSIFLTFCLTAFAWIFFRAENITHAFTYVSKIFSASFFNMPSFQHTSNVWLFSFPILVLIIVEWIGREQQHALQTLGLHWKRPLRYLMYYSIVVTIFLLGGEEQQFIYFQF